MLNEFRYAVELFAWSNVAASSLVHVAYAVMLHAGPFVSLLSVQY